MVPRCLRRDPAVWVHSQTCVSDVDVVDVEDTEKKAGALMLDICYDVQRERSTYPSVILRSSDSPLIYK